MARRKTAEKNIRKITRVGRASLSITIPIDLVRELKWKERQRVTVRKVSKRLIIEDYEPKR